MQVFDFQVPDEELEDALERLYQTRLSILKCEFEYHCQEPSRRLALANVFVQTSEGLKTVTILIKESSRRELTILSLMNKLLPYSSPKVIYYLEASTGMWILLENILTWVDVAGRHRVNETLVDGLYAIQAAFFNKTQSLLESFRMFSIMTGARLVHSGWQALNDIDTMGTENLFKDIFEEASWSQIRQRIAAKLELEPPIFPMTVVHNNYYPNTARAMKDADGGVHVIVYDWQNAAVGWPQIDLCLLLDRLDVIAEYQGLPGPSPILLQRYVERLTDEFDIDVVNFYGVYDICYLCRILPLMRWWMRGYVQSPSRDPERTFLEVRSKLNHLRGWASTGG
jgi:hypothetical protein